jgi:perosamine synthetase
MRYPVYQPDLSGNEKAYVLDCLETSWISSRGAYVSRFEESFAAFIGAREATSVANGTVAIHLALVACDIEPGDEIIVPTLTYVASVNTIVQAGAVPIFCESRLADWQIDVADAEKRITPRTRAIMAVHLYGQACPMVDLQALCRKYNLLLIEDCAEAFGTRFYGQHVGTFGDAATFSFFGNKTLTTGEGGMVVCKDAKAMQRARHLKSQGVSLVREYWHDTLAYNYRMTNIQAAIGLAQLERAEDILRRKRALAGFYREALQGLPLVLQTEMEETIHSWWMVSALVDNPTHRDPLRASLKEAGIETRPLFYPVHTMPMYQHLTDTIFPNATSLAARGFNLPSYPALTRQDVRVIADVIREFFTKI